MNRLIPSYNRYSHHARRALTHAHQLALQLHHPFIDTGHLLVGVVMTKGSVGHSVLSELDLEIPAAESHLKTLAPVQENISEYITNADELNTALALAADESAWLGHHYVGTEHLLLGMTRTNVGNAAMLLRLLNISPEAVRRHVRRALSGGAKEFDLQSAKRDARLSELSRRVINGAEILAVERDHQVVGIGHLLLVMLQETRSPTCALLRTTGLDEAQVQRLLDHDDPVALVSVEVILGKALDQAERLDSHYTGTEHLLLTLAQDGMGIALLHQAGINPEKLRNQVLDQLKSSS
ncbi:MAG: hypothetical protein H6672_14975 [Anaerolineaceae bacterium]|nr:hypothetical protein [Anaerolineaceae bacterium]